VGTLPFATNLQRNLLRRPNLKRVRKGKRIWADAVLILAGTREEACMGENGGRDVMNL
jgi:hypothetical protein